MEPGAEAGAEWGMGFRGEVEGNLGKKKGHGEGAQPTFILFYTNVF